MLSGHHIHVGREWSRISLLRCALLREFSALVALFKLVIVVLIVLTIFKVVVIALRWAHHEGRAAIFYELQAIQILSRRSIRQV